jgi:hypothetical protein
MADYTPNPPVVQKKKPPEYGQWAPYRYEDGDLYPCIIHRVLNSDPEGKYYNVAVSIIYPPKGDHPGKVIRDGKVYWKDLGIVTSDPCGPPWPG